MENMRLRMFTPGFFSLWICQANSDILVVFAYPRKAKSHEKQLLHLALQSVYIINAIESVTEKE